MKEESMHLKVCQEEEFGGRKRKEKWYNYIVISKKLKSNKNICQISNGFDQNLLLYPIINYNLSNFSRAITSLLSFALFKKILSYISMRNSESLSICLQKLFTSRYLQHSGLQNHRKYPNFRIKAKFLLIFHNYRFLGLTYFIYYSLSKT